MINMSMYEKGARPSDIRDLFMYGERRGRVIGPENVLNLCIGSPSSPVPVELQDELVELARNGGLEAHAYTPSPGATKVRAAIAKNLKKRFGFEADGHHVYLTCGAAGGLSITIAAITNPGEEVILIAPYFPEYRIWIETVGAVCVPVHADPQTFQIDVEAVAAAMTDKTAAIIINNPNNPVGAVYSRENIAALAEVMNAAQERFGREIYLISDDPYREIAYGKEVPFTPDFYDRTIVCYSYSKAFSIPGDRIGYIYVSDRMPEAGEVFCAVSGAGRSLGNTQAPAILQYAILSCLDVLPDLTQYTVNRKVLCDGLAELGYEFIPPDGAFYLWVKALEPDARKFIERAKKYELLIVPSDSFGVEGWCRVSYSVPINVIVKALPAFAALKKEYDREAAQAAEAE